MICWGRTAASAAACWLRHITLDEVFLESSYAFKQRFKPYMPSFCGTPAPILSQACSSAGSTHILWAAGHAEHYCSQRAWLILCRRRKKKKHRTLSCETPPERKVSTPCNTIYLLFIALTLVDSAVLRHIISHTRHVMPLLLRASAKAMHIQLWRGQTNILVFKGKELWLFLWGSGWLYTVTAPKTSGTSLRPVCSMERKLIRSHINVQRVGWFCSWKLIRRENSYI